MDSDNLKNCINQFRNLINIYITSIAKFGRNDVHRYKCSFVFP